jgi:PAS domain S-box-containing protein
MNAPLTILIADTNREDRALIVRELGKVFPAAAWIEVRDAAELTHVLQLGCPDLVVTDYQLEWTDGLAFLHQVKARWPDCPVVMFAARATEEIAVEGLKAGLDEYVVKSPRNLGRLRAVVRSMLDRREQGRRQQDAEELIHLQAAALQATADAIVITDQTGTIKWVNAAFTYLTGYAPEEAIGRNPRFLKSDRHPPEFFRQMWETILAGKTWRGEFLNRRKDGSLYSEAQSITPVLNRAGQVTHFIGIKQDISRRKEAEQSLQEHLRLAELIAEVSVCLTQDCSLTAMLRGCTEPIVRHLGASFARIWTLNQKRDVLELQAGSGMHTSFDLQFGRVRVGQYGIGSIARTRQPLITNDLHENPLLPDQEWAHREGLVAFAGLPLVVGDRLVGVLAVLSHQPLIQIAFDRLGPVADQIAVGIERKLGEQALRLSEHRYRYLIDTAPDMICTISAEGLILGVNAAFETIFGWPGADWVGRPFYGLVHPEDLPHALETFSQVLRGEIPPMLEVRCLSRPGNLINVEILTTPQIHDGRVIGALAVVRDVTARKRLEAQYLQAQKMEAMGRLAAGVAHDFNNLLTIINGYSEVLARMLTREERPWAILEEIRKAGERAAGLTHRLLAFSRKQVLIPRVLDLNLVITDLEKMLHRLIGEDVQLVLSLQKPLRPIKADPTHLESIIVNLAVNARDAMPEGGTLVIDTGNRDLDEADVQSFPNARPGAFVLLALTDTGTGIAPDVLPQIFQPFFTTKGPGKGTGLGLATVRDIIEQSRGVIQVDSAVGRGTTFRVYLPQPEDRALTVAARPSAVEVRLRGTETILLAEDDEGVRALTRMVLESRGYKVLEARHGEEAVRMGSSHPGKIDLAMTDLIMPGLSGRNLVQQLQKIRPGIKVLFMSGYLDDALAKHGILESGLPFLQKPFTPDVLTTKVREVLDEISPT